MDHVDQHRTPVMALIVLMATISVASAAPPRTGRKPVAPRPIVGEVMKNADPDVLTPEEAKRLGPLAVGERRLMKNPADISTHLALAEQYFTDSFTTRSKRLDAKRHLDAVLAAQPTNADAQFLAGRMQFADGQIPLAILTLQQAVRLNPNNPHAHIALGEALQKSGNESAATVEYAEFRRLIALPAATNPAPAK